MKIKLLTAWLLLPCLALTACHKKPASEPTETDAPLQTAQVVGIRPAETRDPNDSLDFPTELPETEPSAENTVDCLYEFFMDDTNLNGSPIGPYGGSLYGITDPDQIPNLDRSHLYGTTYRFNLTAHKDKHLFCFRFDTATDLLEVVIPYEKISLLLIFRVEGIEDGGAIVRSAETGESLSATLLYARNIDVESANALKLNASHLKDQPTAMSPSTRSGYIMGYAVEDGTYLRSTWGDHEACQWMDAIISFYREEAS